MDYITHMSYIRLAMSSTRASRGEGTSTIESKSRVLLILPGKVLDRARVLAGRATTALKLPVSLQIVLRVLLDEGLRRKTDPSLLAAIGAHALAVRRTRSRARASGNRAADGTRPRPRRTAPPARPPSLGSRRSATRSSGRRSR